MAFETGFFIAVLEASTFRIVEVTDLERDRGFIISERLFGGGLDLTFDISAGAISMSSDGVTDGDRRE